MIELDEKHKSKAKGVIIKYGTVKGIGDIVFVNKTILNSLRQL